MYIWQLLIEFVHYLVFNGNFITSKYHSVRFGKLLANYGNSVPFLITAVTFEAESSIAAMISGFSLSVDN